MIIATHNGSFHADEAMACAILTHICDGNCRIVRSRNLDVLERADIIIDVSGRNDERHFDHHSPDFNESRPNGIRYATAGLMWRRHGREFLQRCAPRPLGNNIIEAALERIDTEIMQMIDLDDNGQLDEYVNTLAPVQDERERGLRAALMEFYQNSPSIPYLVAMQNLPDADSEEQDRQFAATVRILRSLLLGAAANALATEEGIARVMEIYDGSELLVMRQRLPWSQAVRRHFEDFGKCLLAVYPDRKGGWRVQSLPLSRAERFSNRLSAPRAWRGLNSRDLDAATGLSGTTFVHRSGFTGGAIDFDTALSLARLWLQDGEAAASGR